MSTTYDVTGMTCGHCAQAVTSEIQEIQGVSGVQVDVETGKVIEFVDPELEALQRQIAAKLGYRLVDHRMELYGVRLDRKD